VEITEPPSYPPADLRRRLYARAFDLAIGLLPLFGTGRSLGKRAFGLRVVLLATRRPAGISACLRRNAIFAIALVPALAGAAHPIALSLAVLAVLLAIETRIALRPLTRDFGARRLGDLIAGTQVIDASIALGLKAPIARPAAPAGAGLATPRAARNRLQQPPTARAASARP
jgi:hypothetical protein